MNFTSGSDDTLRELRQLVGSGRFRDAVDYYQRQTDDQWRANPDAQLLAATSATRLGDFSLAAPLAESANIKFREKTDRHGRMRASNLLGVVRIEQGLVAEAEQHLGEALALAHELADSLVAARAANNLATLAHMGNRPETALSLYRSALVTYQRIGDRQGLIETYHNFGIVFRQSDVLDQALEASENALRLAEAGGEPGLLAPALTGLAEVHLAAGESQLAEATAVRARDLAESANDPLSVAEAERILGLAWMREGRLEAALSVANHACELALGHQSRLLEGETTAARALVLRAMNRVVEAEQQHLLARTIFVELGATGYLKEFDAAWG